MLAAAREVQLLCVVHSLFPFRPCGAVEVNGRQARDLANMLLIRLIRGWPICQNVCH